jgi:hypothetical protein
MPLRDEYFDVTFSLLATFLSVIHPGYKAKASAIEFINSIINFGQVNF